VDVLIVGTLGMRDVSALLSGVTDKIGREINTHLMIRDEIKKRCGTKEHFVLNAARSPKL
jgi:hypothetical protein